MHSLNLFTSSLPLIAASSVFLAAKVLYVPVSLEITVNAFFSIEKRLNPSLSRTTLSKDRELAYRDMIEQMETKILEANGFEFEFDLPYRYIRSFCENHANYASKDSLYQLAFKFCNDSFKLPLCLYFHPKIISAACI